MKIFTKSRSLEDGIFFDIQTILGFRLKITSGKHLHIVPSKLNAEGYLLITND
jgi:hypothetical protein